MEKPALFSKTQELGGGVFATAFADSAGLRRVTVGFEKPPAAPRPPEEAATVLRRALAAVSAAMRGEAAQAGKILKNTAADGKTPEFYRKVWRETVKIPYGQTKTYTEIAEQLGGANRRRAVARALAANPFPVLIPCHRVVGKRDGGGYSGGGGREMKQTLLSMEAQR